MRKFFQAVDVSVLLYSCTTWSLNKKPGEKKSCWELHKNTTCCFERILKQMTSCETFRVHAQHTFVTARRHAWLKHPKVSAWRRACLGSMSVPAKPRALEAMATVGGIDQSRVSNSSLLCLLLKHHN